MTYYMIYGRFIGQQIVEADSPKEAKELWAVLARKHKFIHESTIKEFLEAKGNITGLWIREIVILSKKQYRTYLFPKKRKKYRRVKK